MISTMPSTTKGLSQYLRLLFLSNYHAANKDRDIVFSVAEDIICGCDEFDVPDCQACFFENLAFCAFFKRFTILKVASRALHGSCGRISNCINKSTMSDKAKAAYPPRVNQLSRP